MKQEPETDSLSWMANKLTSHFGKGYKLQRLQSKIALYIGHRAHVFITRHRQAKKNMSAKRAYTEKAL